MGKGGYVMTDTFPSNPGDAEAQIAVAAVLIRRWPGAPREWPRFSTRYSIARDIVAWFQANRTADTAIGNARISLTAATSPTQPSVEDEDNGVPNDAEAKARSALLSERYDAWLADHDAGVAARTLREAAEEYRIRAQYDATWQWLIDRAAELRGER